MGKELSRKEAEQRLEKAIQEFDWGKFMMNGKDAFLNSYRAYHAQLREGDQLKIEINHITYNAGYGVVVKTPAFNIILYEKSAEGGKVIHSTYDESELHNPGQILYYNDNG